jgi:uncharacterized membrane protein
MMPMMSGHSYITWLVLATLLLVVAVVAIAIAVTGKGSDRPGPVTELRARYARGEIDDDEYQTKLALLHPPKRVRR